jgi:4a-hydroxytetrahydrobiopterin dehydratase
VAPTVFAVGRKVHTGHVTESHPEGWEVVDGALERTFEFPSFPDGIAFVNRVAEAAEDANHHPDIEIHYRQVKLRWWTHSAQAITDRDCELAERSASLAG